MSKLARLLERVVPRPRLWTNLPSNSRCSAFKELKRAPTVADQFSEMDRKAKVASIKGKLGGLGAWRGRLIKLAIAGVAFGLMAPLLPEVLRQVKFLAGANHGRGPASQGGKGAQGGQGGVIANALATYRQAYDQTVGSMTEKLKAIQQAEAKNTWLKLENENLKIELEKTKYNCSATQNKKETDKTKLKLSREAGSRVGRTLASIDYTPPENLQPAQLYVLALSFLKGREDEKAVYLLTQLTGLEDVNTFKTSQNFLLTGVLWYRMKNYNLADDYFDRAIQQPENKENIAYQARARLWKAVVARKRAKETKVQYWLTELVDHHPHSMESEWVNPAAERASGRREEAKRAPAHAGH